MSEQERQLIERAAAGDAAAFEQLVSKYEKLVYSVTFRMTGNPEDAMDLSQETFIKVWRSLCFFKFESAFSTWVYRIAGNVCLDFLRRQKRHSSLTADEDDTMLDIPDHTQDPEQAYFQRENQEAVQAAMATLEPEYRAAITLRVIGEMSYQEIADALEIQPGTVKSRINRAREKLRKKLGYQGNKVPEDASVSAEGGEKA